MGVVLNNVNSTFAKTYNSELLRQRSRIAALFVNRIIQEGPRFITEIEIPIITKGIPQPNYDPRTGFIETYTTDDKAKLTLKQNFTLYNRISSTDILGENWAANKSQIVASQKAIAIDEYVTKELARTLTNKIENPVNLTPENFLDEIGRLRQWMLKNRVPIEATLIIARPSLTTLFQKLNIQSHKVTIDDMSFQIIDALGLNWVEAYDLVDTDMQLVALVPQAVGWGLAVHVPLMAGTYTQGPFLGQVFVANNEMYDFTIFQQYMVFGYPVATPTTPPEGQQSSKNTKSKQQEIIENITKAETGDIVSRAAALANTLSELESNETIDSTNVSRETSDETTETSDETTETSDETTETSDETTEIDENTNKTIETSEKNKNPSESNNKKNKDK